MIASIVENGSVVACQHCQGLASALDWLIGNVGRYGRIGSTVNVETLDGCLVYSVSIPWQQS